MAKFEPKGSIVGNLTEALTYFKVSSGILVTAGRAVTLVNGFVELHNGNVTEKLLGVSAETVLGTSTSAEIGVYCDPNMIYYSDADGDLANADIGKSYRVTAGGAQIDQSTGAANSTTQFILVNICPIRYIYENLMRIFSKYLGNLSLVVN